MINNGVMKRQTNIYAGIEKVNIKQIKKRKRQKGGKRGTSVISPVMVCAFHASLFSSGVREFLG